MNYEYLNYKSKQEGYSVYHPDDHGYQRETFFSKTIHVLPLRDDLFDSKNIENIKDHIFLNESNQDLKIYEVSINTKNFQKANSQDQNNEQIKQVSKEFLKKSEQPPRDVDETLSLERKRSHHKISCPSIAKKERFIKVACSQGITFDQAKHLYAMGEELDRDVLTGFHSIHDFDITFKKAIEHLQKSQEADLVLKIEIELENLGGLNAKLGHSKSNKVYKDIARIVDQHLHGVQADLEQFREGGLLKFILVGHHMAEDDKIK